MYQWIKYIQCIPSTYIQVDGTRFMHQRQPEEAYLCIELQILLREEMTEPEFAVGILEVGALVATVAVHSVRVDHEVELFACFLEGVDEEEGVLVVYVVVTCAVGDFQHDRIDCRSRSRNHR